MAHWLHVVHAGAVGALENTGAIDRGTVMKSANAAAAAVSVPPVGETHVTCLVVAASTRDCRLPT